MITSGCAFSMEDMSKYGLISASEIQALRRDNEVLQDEVNRLKKREVSKLKRRNISSFEQYEPSELVCICNKENDIDAKYCIRCGQ